MAGATTVGGDQGWDTLYATKMKASPGFFATPFVPIMYIHSKPKNRHLSEFLNRRDSLQAQASHSIEFQIICLERWLTYRFSIGALFTTSYSEKGGRLERGGEDRDEKIWFWARSRDFGHPLEPLGAHQRQGGRCIQPALSFPATKVDIPYTVKITQFGPGESEIEFLLHWIFVVEEEGIMNIQSAYIFFRSKLNLLQFFKHGNLSDPETVS